MRLHREEKINRIIQRQKEMLASGEKNGPVIKKSMQRMAVQSLIVFFTLMFVCTVISRVSLSITTASVSVSTLASGTLTERAFVEGRIQAAADRSIRLPEGLWVTAVNAQEGSQVNKGDPLLAFEVPSMEEQVKKLEEEIHILTLRIDLSESGGGNEVAAAQRALEDAQREYERLASKYVRSDTRLKEDYTKSEEKLAAAETEDDRAAAAVKQELIREAEAVVKEAEENLYSVREAAEDAIHAAEKELDEASENLDASKNAYQKLLEAYKQAESTLDAAKQAVSDIEKAIEEQEPGGDTDYTEELNAAKEELSKAQEEFTQAEKNLSDAEYKTSSYDSAAENLNAIKERWKTKTERAEASLNDANAALTAAKERTDFSDEAAVRQARAAIDAAKGTLNDVWREFEDNQYLAEEALYKAQRAVEAAQLALENAQQQAVMSQKERKITRLTCESELAEKEKLRDKLQEILNNGGYLSAPVSGTVLRTVEKGFRTKAGEEGVTLACNDKGFLFEGFLEEESARYFLAGDKGELMFRLDGSTQRSAAEISSIGMPDEEGKVFLTAVLQEGDYPAGMTAQLSLSKKSEIYHNCLPITALRSDSRGDHVLVIRKQNSVLGTEWVTARVDITVKDRDSQMMCVESALTYADQVITGSNKAITEGDRVRIGN